MPMQIEGAVAYGGVFDLPVFDPYNLKVITDRPSSLRNRSGELDAMVRLP